MKERLARFCYNFRGYFLFFPFSPGVPEAPVLSRTPSDLYIAAGTNVTWTWTTGDDTIGNFSLIGDLVSGPGQLVYKGPDTSFIVSGAKPFITIISGNYTVTHTVNGKESSRSNSVEIKYVGKFFFSVTFVTEIMSFV